MGASFQSASKLLRSSRGSTFAPMGPFSVTRFFLAVISFAKHSANNILSLGKACATGVQRVSQAFCYQLVLADRWLW